MQVSAVNGKKSDSFGALSVSPKLFEVESFRKLFKPCERKIAKLTKDTYVHMEPASLNPGRPLNSEKIKIIAAPEAASVFYRFPVERAVAYVSIDSNLVKSKTLLDTVKNLVATIKPTQ